MYTIRIYQSVSNYVNLSVSGEEAAWDAYKIALDLADITGADIELIDNTTCIILADNMTI